MRACPPILQNSALFFALCSGLSWCQAAPVTAWQKDTSFGGGATAALTGAATSSPVLGDGTANDADNVAIYSAFPLVSLSGGQRLTLTGSAEFIGNSANSDFRWGLFKDDGAPPATGGWLGYMGSAESTIWSKNPAGTGFATATFASVTNDRAITLGQASEPNGRLFNPGVYDFSMTVERFGNETDIRISIANEATGFSIESPTFTESDPSRLTFGFDRVGFLAGSALDADEVRFSGIDVTVGAIDAPTLQVHSSGLAFISNLTSGPLDFTQYEITSNSGALNAAGWLSLDSQEGNDPVGVGWEEAGGSDANVLSEVNLLSTESLSVGQGLRLGNAFSAGGDQDLAFRYATPGGDVLRGLVRYVVTGDYNGSGVVDAGDYTVWRDSLGQSVAFGSGADGDGNGVIDESDYNVWKTSFGAPSAPSDLGSGELAAVPEPTTLAMLGFVSMVQLVARRSRRR